METFPRKPFLDRVIVREIPVEEYYQQPDNVTIDLQNSHIKIRSDRGVVVAAGSEVKEAIVGDLVFFDEFSQCDPIYLNPGDALKADLPKYWQIREADLKGYDVANRETIGVQLTKTRDIHAWSGGAIEVHA